MSTATLNRFFADDLAVTLDEQGHGRPVLLLHGGGGPLTVADLAKALSADFEVLTPTHPGFALTPRPDWFDGVDDIALTYLQLLQQRDLQDVLVIGQLADFFALTPVRADPGGVPPSTNRAT
jgi:pimeloyl-ACP methyl ester carboxylesterase